MSLRTIIWAFDQIAAGCSPSTSASLVLLKVADRANDEGVCWPGRERLGKDINLSDETVRQCLRKLEQAGLVKTERRKDAAGRDLSNVYHLPVYMGLASAKGKGPDFTTPPVKSGGGCLETGPESTNKTTSPLSQRGEPDFTTLDQATGIHYQTGNQDDAQALDEIRRHSQQEITKAVRQAATLDRKGRAWPSAVWKILNRARRSSAGGPPAWATMGDSSAMSATEEIEITGEVMEMEG